MHWHLIPMPLRENAAVDPLTLGQCGVIAQHLKGSPP